MGYNLFAYCFNNPLNMDVSDGIWPKWVKKVARASASTLSGGVSLGSIAIKSATQMLVHKKIQAGANMMISSSAYVIQTGFSGDKMSLYGAGGAVLGGFVSGTTFNAPISAALVISLGLELVGNGEGIISIFGEK